MLVSLRQQKGPNKTESQTSARQLVLVLFLQQGCNEADSVSVGGGGEEASWIQQLLLKTSATVGMKKQVWGHC